MRKLNSKKILLLLTLFTGFSYGVNKKSSAITILNTERATNIEPQVLEHLQSANFDDSKLQKIFDEDFKPFIKYFDTNQLSPHVSMNNITVAFTNKYGMVFINDQQLVLDLKDVDRLAQGTTFQNTYHLIYTNYHKTLKIYKHISNVYFATNLGAWTDEGIQFFSLAEADNENIKMDEIPYNFFTLWDHIKKDTPARFRSFEHFIYTFTAVIGKSSIIKDPRAEKRQFYFLSLYYPVDQPDRFYNAILNFMIYKCWVYGNLSTFNPY